MMQTILLCQMPDRVMRRLICACAYALAFGACQIRGRAELDERAGSHEHDSHMLAPIDTVSLISGCSDLDDCNRKCAAHDARACVSAGRFYEFGHSMPSDSARAYNLYITACDLRFAGGCYNAAVLLEAGKGIARDLSRARFLYENVCSRGSPTACERANNLRKDKPHGN